ncbi:C-X-C motif chemokine 10 [Tupaia chinensis]|uniref:C-X-C motif chemokine n=1 Tax=Tupaia chinensis TaxID=246437 RepID=L9L786_TUPCH|nr:C-X-C motif chemokine 10 [Tupaia chinensis]
MKPSAILLFCLIFLALSGTQGVPLSRTVRCTCITISNKFVHPKALEKLEIIPASQSCPRVEIIATMKKNAEKRCLDPESKAIKNLLKAVSKERRPSPHHPCPQPRDTCKPRAIIASRSPKPHVESVKWASARGICRGESPGHVACSGPGLWAAGGQAGDRTRAPSDTATTCPSQVLLFPSSRTSAGNKDTQQRREQHERESLGARVVTSPGRKVLEPWLAGHAQCAPQPGARSPSRPGRSPVLQSWAPSCLPGCWARISCGSAVRGTVFSIVFRRDLAGLAVEGHLHHGIPARSNIVVDCGSMGRASGAVGAPCVDVGN